MICWKLLLFMAVNNICVLVEKLVERTVETVIEVSNLKLISTRIYNTTITPIGTKTVGIEVLFL